MKKLLFLIALIPASSLAHPFDHFVTDTSALYTQENDGAAGTFGWNPAGSSVTLTCALCTDSRMIRNTNTGDDSDTYLRGQADNAIAPWGAVSNSTDSTHFYMQYMSNTDNTVKLYLNNGGYTVLASASFAQTINTPYVIHLQTRVNGGNEDLTAFVDGVSIVSASTATKLGAGKGGFEGNAVTTGRKITFEWWTHNNSLSFTSITPTSGPKAGGTAFTIVAIDAGPGVLVKIGGNSATAVTCNSAGTTITGITPAGTAGLAPVSIYEGTAGSEEFARNTADAFTYTAIQRGSIMFRGVGQ